MKRTYDGAEKDSLTSPFMPMFERFMQELDAHHDRRERLIKASRDVTALSKKMIFSLQRVRAVGEDIPEKVDKEVHERSVTIDILFTTMASDLQGINAWRYQRQVSPGIQEFVEAISCLPVVSNSQHLSLTFCSSTLFTDPEIDYAQ